MTRILISLVLVGLVVVLGLAGFRGAPMKHTPIEWFNDMAHQPRFDPQHATAFFADGRAARQPVRGTIPLGYILPKGLDNQGGYLQTTASNIGGTFTNSPDYASSGRFGEVFGDGIPAGLAAQGEKFVKRGQERYDIYCSACHGKAGEGNGVAKSFGLMTVRSLVDDQIKGQPDGQIYNTITHGKNTMGAQGPVIPVEDRWAIVAYVRALQKVQTLKAAAAATPDAAPAATPQP